MASSYEISQMFAQQNQMFMGHGQMAQSIGVNAPPLGGVGMGNSGVGAYGMGFSPNAGGYRYGQAQMAGYGPGNAVAGGAMSLGGAAISGGSMLAGGLAMAGVAGAGVASMALAPLAMMAPSVLAGGHHQSQVNTMLGSQYQFFNPQSKTGSGFTRDDSKAIGDSIRQLSQIPELMTSVEEMTRLSSRLKSTGLMQGVNSAADFQARFKEAISTIRDTAKILGTTMEEAEHFFSQSRGAGFYGKSAQLKNAISSQFTSAVTGASLGQVMGAQQAGADMAMSFGARRSLGASAVNTIAQNIGLAQQEGRIGENSVEDVTGMGGPEGQLALAQKMFGGMLQFGQTAPGRLAMAGMMKYENGRAVGVDEDFAKKFNQGLVGHQELMARAGRLTDREKISFTNRQPDLIASLAGQIGPGGAYGMMKGVMGDRFGGDEEAVKLSMHRLTGMSAGELDIAEGMQGVSGEGMSGQMAQMRARHNQQRQRSDPAAIWKNLKTRMRAETLGKLEQGGANIQNSIAKTVDEFFEKMLGTEISTLTEERAKNIAAAFSGSHSAEAEEVLKGLTGLKGDKKLAAGQYSLKDDVLAGLRGNMSRNQSTRYINNMFGTDDTLGQTEIAEKLRNGDIAGKGSMDAVLRMTSQDSFKAKDSDADRMQVLTQGLGAQVARIAARAGMSNEDIAKLSKSQLGDMMKSQGLGKEDAGVLNSFWEASNKRVGNMNVFAQMAAASGAGGLAAGLAGGGGGTLSSLQDDLRESQKTLSGAVGETAAGFISKGPTNSKAFSAVIKDDKLRQAVTGYGVTPEKARLALAEAGITLSTKDAAALQEALKQYNNSSDEDKAKAQQAIDQHDVVSGRLATKEFQQNLVDYGAKMIGEAKGAGTKMEEMQKKMGKAAIALGEKGGAGISDWVKSFSEYSESFKGLEGEELQQALKAGGAVAQQAYGALGAGKSLAASFKGKSATAAEIAKKAGIKTEDVLSTGFKGGELTEEAAKKIAQFAASEKAQVGAQGVAKPEETEQGKLVSVLTKIDANQTTMASYLASLHRAPLSTFLLGAKENSNAGPKGETSVGNGLGEGG